jgi:hypothetical protein
MAFAFSIFMTVWTVTLKERFNFGARDHAYFMGWIGLCYAISQGVLARYLLQLFGGTSSSNSSSHKHNVKKENLNHTSNDNNDDKSGATKPAHDNKVGKHDTTELDPSSSSNSSSSDKKASQQPVEDSDSDPTVLLLLCMLMLSLGRVSAMLTHSVAMVYAIMALVIIALGVVNTAMASACGSLAGPDQVHLLPTIITLTCFCFTVTATVSVTYFP